MNRISVDYSHEIFDKLSKNFGAIFPNKDFKQPPANPEEEKTCCEQPWILVDTIL